MRSKDKGLMHQILEYIDSYYFEYHQTPTLKEIGDGVGKSRSTAYNYLVAMAQENMLEYNDGEILTAKMQKTSLGSSAAPILGQIACGIPDIQEEDVEEYVTLPQSLFGKGDFFILRAYGESMIGAGIEPGDLVVVKKQNWTNDGEIIVALVDGANTLKRLYRDDKRKKVILHPENDTMPDMEFNEVEIQGVAVHVIKKLS